MENDPRTYKAIGACMEVHRIMGPGRLEAVYHECLVYEFTERDIEFISKPRYAIFYKGKKLKQIYIPDFEIFKSVVLEIKSQKCLTSADEAQIINSLITSNLEVGLLINFGEKSLKYKRFINSQWKK